MRFREMRKRLVNWALCICMLSLFFSCSSEQQEGNEGSGTLKVHVSASPAVFVGTNTRENEGTEENIPDVNQFSFSVFKGEALRGEWATLSEFVADDELTLRSGSDYKAKASHGDLSKEGFELPYFEGVQPFAITRGQTTDVEVTCYLANAKLSIVYTDAFKDYFSTYSSEVLTSLGNTVKYSASETRFAYFKPGDLEVRAKVKKKEGYSQEVTLKAKEFTAEARHAYILTLDVDAGTPTLKISFSDEIANEQPVEIEISDEALSAPAPYFKANGFDETQALSIVEGKSAEGTVYAYLQAAGGIAECKLVTNSKTLLEQGWPATVDLADIPAETLAKMQKLGLRIVGLGAKKDKIAMIDFSGVIPFLEYNSGENEHAFTLSATDVLSKVNETPLVLQVNSTDNMFAVSAEADVLYGTTKMKASLTLDGDPSKVSYWLQQGGSEQQVTPASIKSNGTNHDLVFKFNQSQYTDVKIEARYLRRKGEMSCTMGEPSVKLSQQYPGDVWTKQATLQLSGDVTGWNFQRQNSEGWDNADYTLNGTAISLTKLPSNTALTYRFMKKDEEGDIVGTSSLLTIHTEEELALPNAGMEEWSYVSGTNDWWRKWYPWSDDESQGWNTINEKTTADGGGGIADAYAYIANSGTIQTSDKYSGSSAALIRTVGWGKGTTAPGPFNWWDGSMKKVDPGFLYLGDYTESPETVYSPRSFKSRPTAISFYYKYQPAKGKQQSNDVFEFRIIVENRDNNNVITLANQYVKEGGVVSNYTYKKVLLNYSGDVGTKYKATHLYILFKSGSVTEYKYFQVPSGANLSDGQYIGSQLYIDDIKLEYAK